MPGGATGFLSLFTEFLTFWGFKRDFWRFRVIFLTFASETAVRRERGRSLLLFWPMNSNPQIHALEQKLEALIASDPDLFLVEVRVKPTNNFKVFVDGDQGVSIDRLVQLNRKLYRQIEEEAWFPAGDFSLEISSPGLDEPLKLFRQYLKNRGRFVEVVKQDGTKVEGKMTEATETEIQVEEEKGKGKKKETVLHSIAMTDIKATKIQIKF